jgi:biotin operon repressor
MVVGKKLDTLLPDVMSLFAQVSPSEKATSKAFRAAARLQDIFEKAKKSSTSSARRTEPSRSDQGAKKAKGGGGNGMAMGASLNALKEALNTSMADVGEVVKHLAQHGMSLESVQVQEQFRLVLVKLRILLPTQLILDAG